MRRTIQLTQVDGATAVGTLSANLPMGLDYFTFYAIDTAGNALLANMTNVRHYANGDTLKDITGLQQSYINLTDKLPAYATDSCLSIHLDQLGMKTPTAAYGTTLNTLSPDANNLSVTTSRLEIITNAGSAPSWQLYADVDDSTSGGCGFIERTKAFGSLSVGTAEKSFATVFPFGSPDVRYWRRLLIANLSAGSITLGRILRGSAQSEVFRRTTAIGAHIVNDYGIRAIAAGVGFLYDGTETGIPETWDTMVPSPLVTATAPASASNPPFVTCGSMDVRLTASAAITFDAIHVTQGKF